MMVFSGIACLAITFMSIFLVALFRETRRVKIGLLARIWKFFGIGNSHGYNGSPNLMELATLQTDDLDSLVVMVPRARTGLIGIIV